MRASILETGVMAVGIFLLVANSPTEWVVTRDQGELDAGGGLFVSTMFLAIAGFLAVQMNGRWREFIAIVRREPLLLFFLLWATMSVFWSDDFAFSVRRAAALIVASYMGAHFVLRFPSLRSSACSRRYSQSSPS